MSVEDEFRRCGRCGLPFKSEFMYFFNAVDGDIWICEHCIENVIRIH